MNQTFTKYDPTPSHVQTYLPGNSRFFLQGRTQIYSAKGTSKRGALVFTRPRKQRNPNAYATILPTPGAATNKIPRKVPQVLNKFVHRGGNIMRVVAVAGGTDGPYYYSQAVPIGKGGDGTVPPTIDGIISTTRLIRDDIYGDVMNDFRDMNLGGLINVFGSARNGNADELADAIQRINLEEIRRANAALRAYRDAPVDPAMETPDGSDFFDANSTIRPPDDDDRGGDFPNNDGFGGDLGPRPPPPADDDDDDGGGGGAGGGRARTADEIIDATRDRLIALMNAIENMNIDHNGGNDAILRRAQINNDNEVPPAARHVPVGIEPPAEEWEQVPPEVLNDVPPRPRRDSGLAQDWEMGFTEIPNYFSWRRDPLVRELWAWEERLRAAQLGTIQYRDCQRHVEAIRRAQAAQQMYR